MSEELDWVRLVHPQAGAADFVAATVPFWRSRGWEPDPSAEEQVTQDRQETMEPAASEPPDEEL